MLFNNACRTCHSVKEGDNRLGPNLHGIIGRKSGSLKNYGYSESMAKSDLVWDKPTLDRFIADPESGGSRQHHAALRRHAVGGGPTRIIAHLENK